MSYVMRVFCIVRGYRCQMNLCYKYPHPHQVTSMKMKTVLSTYMTYVLVVFGLLIGVLLREFIRRFVESTTHNTTLLHESVAERLGNSGYSNSKSYQSNEATAFDRSAAEHAGFPEYSTSKSKKMIETAVFEKSMAESFGFLKYAESKWVLKKQIHASQLKRQHGQQDALGRVFFQYNWEPTWSCGFEQRMGSISDGGKWVCDAYRIAEAGECNILSVGSNNDWSFETAMHALNPRCRIHTFDHTSGPAGKPAYAKFYATCLGSADSGSVRTMDGILRMAGLENKTVDILKIDCEGCEFDVYSEFTKGFIRQVLVEVHMRPQTTPVQVNAMFEHMHTNGYVIFHKEPNTSGCGGDCIEYAFLKLNLSV